MKYIIDIPDTGYVSEETGQLYLPLRSAECDESRNPTWIITGYHCEPYTEPDRKTIEDEVWAFAKKVRLEEFIDEEGRLHGYISGFNSYSEAKAKYEAWRSRFVTINNKKYKIVKEGDGKCILEEI